MVSGPFRDLPLPPDLERFVLDRVRAGKYATEADVITAGLRALREREGDLAELRRKIAEGLAQAHAGDLLDGEAAFAQIDGELDRLDQGRRASA